MSINAATFSSVIKPDPDNILTITRVLSDFIAGDCKFFAQKLLEEEDYAFYKEEFLLTACKDDDTLLIDLLLTIFDYKPDYISGLIFKACNWNRYRVLELLLKVPNITLDPETFKTACRRQYLECLILLLNDARCDSSQLDDTTISYLYRGDDNRCLKLIVDDGKANLLPHARGILKMAERTCDLYLLKMFEEPHQQDLEIKEWVEINHEDVINRAIYNNDPRVFFYLIHVRPDVIKKHSFRIVAWATMRGEYQLLRELGALLH